MAKIFIKEKYGIQSQEFSAAYEARVRPACHEMIKGYYYLYIYIDDIRMWFLYYYRRD